MNQKEENFIPIWFNLLLLAWVDNLILFKDNNYFYFNVIVALNQMKFVLLVMLAMWQYSPFSLYTCYSNRRIQYAGECNKICKFYTIFWVICTKQDFPAQVESSEFEIVQFYRCVTIIRPIRLFIYTIENPII